MKIYIERGKKRYEVVPCGRRCSFYKRWRDFDGRMGSCIGGCRCHEWWKNFTIEIYGERNIAKYKGLREIAEATKPPYYAKAQRKAHAEAVRALEQWGRKAVAK